MEVIHARCRRLAGIGAPAIFSNAIHRGRVDHVCSARRLRGRSRAQAITAGYPNCCKDGLMCSCRRERPARAASSQHFKTGMFESDHVS